MTDGTPAPLAFVDEGLGNSSYLIDIGDGRALVVDPSRHPGPYLAEAERRGMQVAFAVETHLHADFVSGSRELAALGATVVAPAAGCLEFPALGLAHEESVDLGGLHLRGLIAPDQTEPLARQLWRSLHERILSLPDDQPVYPTHGAGSFCSAPVGGERTTTIGVRPSRQTWAGWQPTSPLSASSSRRRCARA